MISALMRSVGMKQSGFEPALVVETSPRNFQAWLNHGRIISDRFLSTRLAKELACRFAGDLSSADWRHFGRLAGFTNQKQERRLESESPAVCTTARIRRTGLQLRSGFSRTGNSTRSGNATATRGARTTPITVP